MDRVGGWEVATSARDSKRHCGAGANTQGHCRLLPSRDKAIDDSWSALFCPRTVVSPKLSPRWSDVAALNQPLEAKLQPATRICAADNISLQALVKKGSVSLSNLNLCPRSATGLALDLRENSLLETLDISRNCIGDPGTTAIAAALKMNTRLETLEMGSNGLSVHGVECLGNALKHNRMLRVLEISYNGFGNDGAEMLSRSLTANSSLQHLGLGFNGIMEDGAAAVAAALENNMTLTSLELSYNAIGDCGAAALCRALAPGCALRTLRLNSNAITDQGAIQIAEALEAPGCEISTLEIAGNCITNVGAARLAKALWRNSRLQVLRVEENSITEAGRVLLREAEVGTCCVTELGDDLKMAVAMGQHGRLGGDSLLFSLGSDVMRTVMQMCATTERREVVCYPKHEYVVPEEDLEA